MRLDVTDPAGWMEAGRAEIGERPLAGLVNNAGIAVAAPLEFVPAGPAAPAAQEVNLIGQVAVIQACLPALRRGRRRDRERDLDRRPERRCPGRGVRGLEVQLEAVSDSLRREVRQFGVNVIVIEPGG